MVQRTAVRGISRYGRLAQGVRLMHIKEDDLVSAVALIVEGSAVTPADAEGDLAIEVDPTTGGATIGVDPAADDGLGRAGAADEPQDDVEPDADAPA